MSEQRTLGAAVVGTGFGVLTHARALRAAGFEVRALVGRNPERTAERAARFGIPHAFTSLADALALPGVDAVTIATPPHTHAEIALAAIAAGKHVLCEKPFARDAAEAERMLAAARIAGIVHLLGTEFRFAPGQALLARTVASGAIGEPRLATFLLHMALLADPKGELPDWWQDAKQGGGWLGAHASHVIDQVRQTLGDIAGVSAGLRVVSDRGMSAEDTYTVHFRTEAGAEGILQSSAGAFGPPLVASRIAGSRGTAWLQGDEVWLADRTGARKLALPDDLRTAPPSPPPAELLHTAYDAMHASGLDMGPFTRLAEVFRDRILGRPVPSDPAPATFADGLAAQRVLDAIRRSATERAWVPVRATG